MVRGSSILAAALTWLASTAFYLALVSSYSVREYIAAAISGGIAATATLIFSHSGKVFFRLKGRDIMQLWRMPWYVLSGTWEILEGLAKQLFSSGGAPSVVAVVPFEIGDRENLTDAGRRALAVSYTTATPNFLVLALIDDERWMLYHQIIPGDVLTMTEELGARP